MAKPEWRDPAKEKQWRRLLGQWRRSGRTGRDFCAEHQLSEPSFYAWKREIARRDQERGQEGDQERTARPKTSRASTTQASASRRSAPRGSGARALPAFMQVTTDAAVSAAGAVEVVVASGRLLRVRRGFDAQVLRQLLAVLEEPSC
jgi:hypothetical protein